MKLGKARFIGAILIIVGYVTIVIGSGINREFLSYIGLAISIGGLIYTIYHSKCPHCGGLLRSTMWKKCPHCGKELKG